ncbi:TSUP family transporter [Desulfosporosinus sp. SYSU MS00001]|uniref:TSUP family transporter n=1 Tax=Desulfosporosinus sp. SYSU MS00001 TaxID=3416284 RepID=UPI003CE73533
MLTLTTLYIVLVVLMASLLQTLTGFGYALLATPLLTLVLGTKEVVMFTLVTSTLVNVIMICRTAGKARFRQLIVAFVASIVGILPGLYVMKVISESVLKGFVGIVLILSSLLMTKSTGIKIHRQGLFKAVLGFISGFLTATTGLGGPPMVLCMIALSEDKELVRASLARLFLLSNIVTLSMSYFTQTFHLDYLNFNVLFACLAIFLGYWIGEKLFVRLDFPTLKKFGLIIILISGLAMLAQLFLH